MFKHFQTAQEVINFWDPQVKLNPKDEAEALVVSRDLFNLMILISRKSYTEEEIRDKNMVTDVNLNEYLTALREKKLITTYKIGENTKWRIEDHTAPLENWQSWSLNVVQLMQPHTDSLLLNEFLKKFYGQLRFNFEEHALLNVNNLKLNSNPLGIECNIRLSTVGLDNQQREDGQIILRVSIPSYNQRIELLCVLKNKTLEFVESFDLLYYAREIGLLEQKGAFMYNQRDQSRITRRELQARLENDSLFKEAFKQQITDFINKAPLVEAEQNPVWKEF